MPCVITDGYAKLGARHRRMVAMMQRYESVCLI